MTEQENESGSQTGDESDERVALCAHCLTPFSVSQHYCEKCGEAVGQFTPYIPFVNIRFNYSIFAKMWHKIWFEKESCLCWKLFYLFLIVCVAPIMLVGLPFIAWEKFKKRSSDVMKLMRVEIPKSKLEAIPEKQRVLFVHLGSILNELNILQKSVIFSSNGIESLSKVEKRGQVFQSLFFIRILAGKLNESWEMLKKDVFSTPLFKDCEDALSPVARDSLSELKKYFSRENNIHLIRDKFAFHYDSDRVREGISQIPEDEVLEMFVCNSGNCLYCFSDVIVSESILNSINPCDRAQAMDTLIKEVVQDVSGWFRQFGEDCIRIIAEKSGLMDCTWVEIPEPPLIDNVKLPYFTKKSGQQK